MRKSHYSWRESFCIGAIPVRTSRGGNVPEHSHAVRKTNVNIFVTFHLLHHSHPPIKKNINGSAVSPNRVTWLRLSDAASYFVHLSPIIQAVRVLLGAPAGVLWGTCRREGSQSRSNSTRSPMEPRSTAPEPPSECLRAHWSIRDADRLKWFELQW